jgi:Cof subfamily protein (haloacid dehalogenase superfamily)
METHMNYKILFIDVDGTLMCPERKYLTQRSISLLKRLQEEGVLVVPTTGRGFTAIRPQILGGITGDYSICFNGACVLERTGKILYGHPMSEEQMDILCRLAEENGYSLGFSFLDGYYTYFRDSIFREFYRQTNGDMECLLDGTDRMRHQRDMPYCGWGMVPLEKAAEFNQGGHGLSMVPFKDISHDICQTGITKATGAGLLLESLGLDRKDTVAIGDGANDCELLRMAGIGIAMGNAVEQAKEAADYITKDVLEDGAAEAIIEFFGLPEEA